MNKKLPVYKLEISEDMENAGVSFIALVNTPAITKTFFAFDGQMRFAADKERQLITTPAMIPNLPIYRKDDERGEFYVVFEPEQVEKIQHKFMKDMNLHKVNAMHEPDLVIPGIFMVNSFTSDKQMGITGPEMFKDLPEKTWFITYKVDNKGIWDEFIKTGEFTGVSVEGVFDMVDPKAELEKKILKTAKEILS